MRPNYSASRDGANKRTNVAACQCIVDLKLCTLLSLCPVSVPIVTNTQDIE